MKITLCASLSFLDEINNAQRVLQSQGHTVFVPRSAETGQTKAWWEDVKQKDPKEFYAIKSERMRGHFNKIAQSDAILVLNYEKNGVAGYIGVNTLMEMAVAFYLDKSIYMLYPTPDVFAQEEICALQPIILHGDVTTFTRTQSE